MLFPSNMVNSTGKAFVKSLFDCLWVLDGHHDTLQKQSCHIPEVFGQFSGFNMPPELSKHRKREATNINSSVLKASAMSLFQHLQASFWNNPAWLEFKQHVETLANSIVKYTEYRMSQNKAMKEVHLRSTPARQLSDTLSVKYIPSGGEIHCHNCDELSVVLEQKNYNEYIFLNDYIPCDTRKRYDYLQNLTNNGLKFPIMHLTYSPGNNVGNFVLRVAVENSVEECFQRSLTITETIKPNIPQFHTRAMQKLFFEKFGRVCPGIKSSVLRYFYRDLTGDFSASHDFQEAVIDERVPEILSMEHEDPNTLVGLREVRKNDTRTKFECFWDKAKSFINEEMGTAVGWMTGGMVRLYI